VIGTSSNYGLIRSRALAALRDRHPLEYADLLAVAI
jgi:hypothetical protein